MKFWKCEGKLLCCIFIPVGIHMKDRARKEGVLEKLERVLYFIFRICFSMAVVIADVMDTRALSISSIGLLLRSMKLNDSRSLV